MKTLKMSLIVLLAVVFAVACSTDQATNHNQNANHAPEAASAPSAPTVTQVPAANANEAPKEAAKTPTDEKKKEAAKPADSAKPSPKIDAAALFSDQKCGGCHGADGKGKLKGTPDFTDAAWQKKETDAEFTAQIKNGKKPMPAYADKLSGDEIKALVSYVRSFAKK